MAEIYDFPAEILEMIFEHLDGQSFARLSQVCKKWQQISRHMEKGFWKLACLKEITLCILEELVGRRYIVNINEKHHDWKRAYKSWFRGRMIQDAACFTKYFETYDSDNPITCIKASGSWVVTGHSSGSIYAWNQFSGTKCHVFIQHLTVVKDFALVDILHSGPYGSIDNPWDHHHIISISKDPTVQINSLLIEAQGLDDELQIAHYHSCGLNTIRTFGNLAAVSSSDNTILVFEMEYVRIPNHRLSLALIHQIVGPSENLRSFGFWHHEFQCFCFNGVRKIFSSSGEQWQTILPYLMSKHSDRQGKAVKRASITNSFLFRDKIVFLISTDESLLISIDGENFCRYPLMSTIKSSIICITMYSSILALGTDNGYLLLYHIPTVTDLLKLNLAEPSFSSYLSEASIIKIDMAESDNSPVVVACTTESIYVVKWHWPRNLSGGEKIL